MSSNRRSFLKNITLSTGALATSIDIDASEKSFVKIPAGFNMCGYAAPKLPTVRVGVVGLGMRGPGAVDRLSYIEGVEIKALCDKYADRVEKAQSILTKKGLPPAKSYSGEEGWKALCESNEIDLVYVTTPWHLHTPISVYAMKNGKHAASEVPAAKTIDECWELVETSEKTKKHMMMLENCCYDFFELLTLNMARNGLFGEIVHAEGAYIHDLTKDYLFNKNAYADMWRLKENMTRNGSLYPTHGLGPIAQCMNINRGDKFEYLVSMSTNDFTMGSMANELASKDDFFKPYANKNYRGNMNTTVIKTNFGKTLMVQHDVSTIRPYSRIHLVSGTKGAAQKWPGPEKIALGHGWMKPEEQKQMQEKYTLPIVKHIGEIAKNVGGHGGMDFIMDWRLIDCLRNGLPLDQDVYDAASWTSAGLLSEVSLKKRSASVDVPDFTRGAWQSNKPHDLTLNGGGNTGVRSVSK
ncbi:MAG: Gfo/Idh/MocA family protein [Bacteroidota bacterium]